MAAPGDPNAPDDHDDLIGFTSPSSLAGAERRSAARPETPGSVDRGYGGAADNLFDNTGRSETRTPTAAHEPEPQLHQEPPYSAGADDLGPLFSSGAAEPSRPTQTEPRVATTRFVDPARSDPRPAPVLSQASPEWAREAGSSRSDRDGTFGRSKRGDALEGGMGLYAVYALILFAVPTLGVSAFVALFAVTRRAGPEQPLARSHFLFQQRTLWIAAAAGVVGAILIAVNLGVFVLVIMALWVLIRGTVGLLRLASGKPVRDPKTLFI